MLLNKKLFIFFLYFKIFLIKSFYDEIDLDYEYNFSCKENCDIHYSINDFYKKISKIWFLLDCFQSIQTGIPENENIFFEIISDYLKSFKTFQEKYILNGETLKHKDDIKILREILKTILIHPVVENNEVLCIILNLTESNLELYENK